MQLLLPSAKSAVLVVGEPSLWERFKKYHGALYVLGLIVVLMGGLDLISRMPAAAPGDTTLQTAFAPAVLLVK